MIRVGVISNPRSERNRTSHQTLRAAAEGRPGVLYAEIAAFDDLPQIITRFARAQVELVVVDGGDGTVQAVLTAVLRNPEFRALPRFSVIPSGMTNLIAMDVGVKGRGAAALDRLLEALESDAPALQITTRPVLRVERASSASSGVETLYGMFFGASAFYHATKLARQRIHPLGIRYTSAVGATIVAAAGQLLRAGGLRDGEPMAVDVDGVRIDVPRHFVLLVTPLDRLVLGLRPFWGQGAGPLRYLDVAAPPRRFWRALFPTLIGRPRPWMEAAGYRSGRAERLTLALRSPFVLDGEIFEPASTDVVHLSAGPMAEFMRL